MRQRGFTLLEVMVATAILGLALTVILSAQGGLAASNKSATMMGTAIGLGRCKMSELEEKLLKFGYPDIDDLQAGVLCCNDEESPGYKCDSRVEKVILPNPPSAQTGGDGGMAIGAASASSGLPAGIPSGLPADLPGPLGSVLQNAAGTGGALDMDGGSLAQLNLDGGLQGMGSALTQQMGGGGMGTQGLLNMVMGFVYPSLKPLMEMSIRRLTVTVHYQEGPNKREFSLVQYVTNPQNGGFLNGIDGGAPATSGSSAPGAPGAPASPGGSPSPLGAGPGGATPALPRF